MTVFLPLSRLRVAAAAALVGATVAGLPAGSSAAGPAITALSSQASSSGFPVGVAVFDTANLGFGVNPTGTITFSLFDLDDPVCGQAPIFTSNVAVTGNGYYQSTTFVVNVAGTYRWVARYSGDANNKSAMSLCSNSGATVAVGKRTPTLSGDASTLDASGAATNTARVNGGGPSGPTGSVTFRLFGPGNQFCTGSPVFTSTKTVAGSASYTSDAFRPTASGTYQWLVTYSGDANNNATGTTCTDPANALEVASTTAASGTGSTGGSSASGAATPSGPSLTVSPVALRGSETLTVNWAGIRTPSSTDWVGLFAVGSDTVKVWKYTNGASAGSTTLRVPYGTVGGEHEVRLMANGTTSRLATAPVKVL